MVIVFNWVDDFKVSGEHERSVVSRGWVLACIEKASFNVQISIR